MALIKLSEKSDALSQITSQFLNSLDSEATADYHRDHLIPLFVAAHWDKIEPLYRRMLDYCGAEEINPGAFFNRGINQQLAAADRR